MCSSSTMYVGDGHRGGQAVGFGIYVELRGRRMSGGMASKRNRVRFVGHYRRGGFVGGLLNVIVRIIIIIIWLLLACFQ